MPIVIENEGGLMKTMNSSGTCGWDVTAASTLFWELVPVRTKLAGQDDRIRELTVRILFWDNSARRIPKTLGMIMTSEDNHFFLYTLEVSEEDFAALRQDQGILVDFASFPNEMIPLLQCCIASKAESNPKYACGSRSWNHHLLLRQEELLVIVGILRSFPRSDSQSLTLPPPFSF